MSGLNSLDRVLAILDLFTEDRLEWTPEELMQELGYSRPTLYRYLKTMKDAGLLASYPNAGFTLGPRVVEMDYLMRKSDAMVRHGRPHLEDLTARYPCSALLVRWYGQRILCVAADCSIPDPLSSYPRGRPMPLARGAISRSIMAFLPRRQMLAMIEENFDELRSIGLGSSVADIAERMREVRKLGYAVACGEVTPGVVGIAAPVFDTARVPVASLCVTIAGTLAAAYRIDEIGGRVSDLAERISAQLERQRAEDETKQAQEIAPTARRA